jgi:hypothetical protein
VQSGGILTMFLGNLLPHSSNLKAEAICSSERWVTFYETTQHHTSEICTVNIHLTSHATSVFVFHIPSLVGQTLLIKFTVIFLLRELKQGLGLKTCPFKAQGVLDLSAFSRVFQHPFVPGAVNEKLFWVSGFCPFFPGGRTRSFDIS